MKPSRLTRRTPIPRGDSQLKRSRLEPVSDRRREREREAKECYADAHGIGYAAARVILGEEIGLWPKIVRNVRDPNVCRMFHELHKHCWVCLNDKPSRKRPIEAHHGASGFTRGKSDDMCVMFALCSQCHADITKDQQGYLWFLKWKFDRPHCNWIRAAQLFGHHLPDLIERIQDEA